MKSGRKPGHLECGMGVNASQAKESGGSSSDRGAEPSGTSIEKSNSGVAILSVAEVLDFYTLAKKRRAMVILKSIGKEVVF